MLDFFSLSQIVIALFAASTMLQQAGMQSFIEPITNSLNQFATTIAEAAPKIVAALILLGIGLLIGRIIGWIVRKVAEKMNLDRYWNRTGIGESVSRAGWNLTRIISVAARWFVYLFFISAAVNVLEFTQLSQAINDVWLWIPNVVAFIIILVIGALIADFVGRWMQRELPARGVVGGKAIALVATGILYAIVLVVATTQLQIGEAILNSVISALIWGMAAAIAIGVGVGLAYGLREAFPAMIRGTTQIQPTLKQGQRITIGGVTTGTVQEAGSFSVILKDDQGKTIVIPTKNILDKEIIIESGPAPATQEKAVEENRGAAASSSS
jgi:mechanosensitive ion channel-like protein